MTKDEKKREKQIINTPPTTLKSTKAGNERGADTGRGEDTERRRRRRRDTNASPI